MDPLIVLLLLSSVKLCSASVAPNFMYDVQFSTDPIPESVAAAAEAASPSTALLSHVPDGWQPMTLPNGSSYLCRVPSIASLLDSEKTSDPVPMLKSGQLLPEAAKKALSLSMANLCVQKVGGWFSYDICWERHVRQYHAEGSQLKAEYFLGKGPSYKLENGATDDLTFRVHATGGPYVAARLLNGTVCDLTGKERVAELRLFCLPEGADEKISLEMTEPETCKYVITMSHPKACIPQLQRVQGTQVPIVCYRL
jgi:protein OS-9